MYSRKEGPRSSAFFVNSVYRSPYLDPGSPGSPFPNPKMIEYGQLFLEEERLAGLIADTDEQGEPQTVSRDTVEQTVTTARKVARTGFPLYLVDLDEILDTAQIYASESATAAALNQLLATADPVHEYPHESAETILYRLTVIRRHGPEAEQAGRILVKLLASLNETENPAWVARVAAVLAYYSALEN